MPLVHPEYISIGTADIYIAPAVDYIALDTPQLIGEPFFYKGLAEEVGIEISSSVSTYKPCNSLSSSKAYVDAASFMLYMRSIEVSPDMFQIAIGDNPEETTGIIELGTGRAFPLRVEIRNTFPIAGKQMVGVFPNMVVNPNFNPRLTPTAEAVYELQFIALNASGLVPETAQLWANNPIGYFKYI